MLSAKLIRGSIIPVVSLIALATANVAEAAIITFDDLVTGQTSYSADGDGDGKNDVIFSTTYWSGFNTIGPGPTQSYINEPGLESNSIVPAPDLRADFLVGAKDFLKFGFALNSRSENRNTFASFQVFDSSNNLLASSTVPGLYSLDPKGSFFPGGLINVTFSGTASYALFDFSSDRGRYIIDNFEGRYGTTEVKNIPEPASTLGILTLGVLGTGSCFKRQSKQKDRKHKN